jgi:predicted transglutaminase-like cysteine proteinase
MAFHEHIVYSEKQLLDETLHQMKIMELENSKNFAFRFWVKQKFSRFTGIELLKEVWQYVINNFIYEDDSADENLIAPKWLVNQKRGDCDDFALFIKTVLSILQVPCNYLLAGKTTEGFSHITVITTDGIILDGTNDKFNFLPDEYTNLEVVS